MTMPFIKEILNNLTDDEIQRGLIQTKLMIFHRKKEGVVYALADEVAIEGDLLKIRNDGQETVNGRYTLLPSLISQKFGRT